MRGLVHIAVAGVLLTACPGKERAAPQTAPDAAAPPPTAPTASVTHAAVDAGPVLDASPSPTAKTMRLTWVIYPVVMRSNLPIRKIELVLRAGEVVQRLSTEVRGPVSYVTSMQPDCSRKPGPVKDARLYMNGGGNTELVADRHGDELWLSEEDSTDGLCEPSPCPVTRTQLGRMAVPADVTFEERFHIVESAGDEHDESCEAR